MSEPAHDLPPRWDGHAVAWDGWQVLPRIFLCPPSRDCCTACGSLAKPLMNRGMVAQRADTTHAAIAANDTARDRLTSSTRHKLKRVAWYELTAFRCPDCRHDTVVNHRAGEVWDLDDTDYGDEGSTHA